jgi:hypothetical protein
MRPSPKSIVLLLTAAVLGASPLHAEGLLDRIRQKAEEAADSVRDAREGVGNVMNADESVVAKAEASQRGVQREIEAATDVEGRAHRAASDSELGRSARESELEAARIETADERLGDEARREVAAVERDVRNATDVESRVERAARSSEPGRAVAESEREIQRVEQTDERARAQAERRVDAALVGGAQRGVGRTEREVRDTRGAFDNLESALE